MLGNVLVDGIETIVCKVLDSGKGIGKAAVCGRHRDAAGQQHLVLVEISRKVSEITLPLSLEYLMERVYGPHTEWVSSPTHPTAIEADAFHSRRLSFLRKGGVKDHSLPVPLTQRQASWCS